MTWKGRLETVWLKVMIGENQNHFTFMYSLNSDCSVNGLEWHLVITLK